MIRNLWLFTGWIGVATALVLSLGPAANEPAVLRHADKLVHMAGYATLMFWWAQLYPTASQRIQLALTLILLGMGIEWLQGFTPTRQSDIRDVLANTLGIGLGGWIAAYLPNVLRVFFPARN